MTRKFKAFITLTLVALLLLGLSAPVATAEETAEPKVQAGTVSYDVDMSKYEEGKTVRVWLPIPQTDKYQEVSKLQFAADEAQIQMTVDEEGNQILYLEWNGDAAPENRKATVSFHVTRTEILRPELLEEGEIGEEFAPYLEASGTVPVDGEVKELADEITAGEENVLGKTRAIYDWIIANMNRDNDVIGCGLGEVETLLTSLAGKCTDIHSVFVALCRAAGIPARETFGVRMNADDITGNQHCWTEFYLPGTGWVIADPADVLKAVLTNEWDKEAEETKELQEYFWGGCDERRVALAVGRDIVLNPKQAGEPLNNFGYPYAEVNDEVIDFYSPADFVYSISFVQD